MALKAIVFAFERRAMGSFKMPVAVAGFANSRFDVMTLATRRLVCTVARCALYRWLTGQSKGRGTCLPVRLCH